MHERGVHTYILRETKMSLGNSALETEPGVDGVDPDIRHINGWSC